MRPLLKYENSDSQSVKDTKHNKSQAEKRVSTRRFRQKKDFIELLVFINFNYALSFLCLNFMEIYNCTYKSSVIILCKAEKRKTILRFQKHKH